MSAIMQNIPRKSLAQEVLGYQGAEVLEILTYTFVLLGRFFTYRVLRLTDMRTVYGTRWGREVFAYPSERTGHTIVKGKTGFGKTALLTNMAIQHIRQGRQISLTDPDGDPRGSGGLAKEVFTRASSVKNLVFLSVNQNHKVIGCNHLFLIAGLHRQSSFKDNFDELGSLRDRLINAIIYDSKEGIEKGHEVANALRFTLESIVYFHNAYAEWLILERQLEQKAKGFIQARQITFNDLANLQTDSPLIDLLIQILGYRQSRYYRPDLVQQWQKLKRSRTFDSGFKGAIGRFAKIVSTYEAEQFFESHGFDLVQELKKGRNILSDLSGLDPFTTAMISKLNFTAVFIAYQKKVLTKNLELYEDESANLELSRTDRVVARGRKMGLSVTMAYHSDKEFSNRSLIQVINDTADIKVSFRNSEGSYNAPLEKVALLKKRHFILENARGVLDNVRTKNMPSVKRAMKFTERGLSREEIRERRRLKTENILDYFTKFYPLTHQAPQGLAQRAQQVSQSLGDKVTQALLPQTSKAATPLFQVQDRRNQTLNSLLVALTFTPPLRLEQVKSIITGAVHNERFYLNNQRIRDYFSQKNNLLVLSSKAKSVVQSMPFAPVVSRGGERKQVEHEFQLVRSLFLSLLHLDFTEITQVQKQKQTNSLVPDVTIHTKSQTIYIEVDTGSQSIAVLESKIKDYASGNPDGTVIYFTNSDKHYTHFAQHPTVQFINLTSETLLQDIQKLTVKTPRQDIHFQKKTRQNAFSGERSPFVSPKNTVVMGNVYMTIETAMRLVYGESD